MCAIQEKRLLKFTKKIAKIKVFLKIRILKSPNARQ